MRFALESRFGDQGAALAEAAEAIGVIDRPEAIHRAVVSGEPLETVREMSRR